MGLQSPNSGGLYGTGSNPNSHYVSPHSTQSGTYVQPHYQTNPNNSQLDNYSTRGNLNPYTGQYASAALLKSCAAVGSRCQTCHDDDYAHDGDAVVIGRQHVHDGKAE